MLSILYIVGNIIAVIIGAAAIWLYVNLFAILSVMCVRCVKENITEEREKKLIMIVEIAVLCILAIVVFFEFVL